LSRFGVVCIAPNEGIEKHKVPSDEVIQETEREAHRGSSSDNGEEEVKIA
jgi:hypothetical protein